MVDKLTDDILSLYNHYKIENDVKESFNKDMETEAMKIFVDKIERLREEGTEITTKHLKNALL
jgi:transcription antitermination factor NusG